MSDVDDLVTWLRAQLDVDERIADRVRADVAAIRRAGDHSRADRDERQLRWVYADIEAKRLIVDDCAEYVGTEAATDGLSARTLAYLALPYADRAGYRDEWKPEQ